MSARRSVLAGILSPRALGTVNVTIVAACVAVAAAAEATWEPLALLAVLAVFTTLAEFGAVSFPGKIEGSLASLGLALAMTCLGPGPAVAIAVVPVTLESPRRGVPWPLVLGNAAT